MTFSQVFTGLRDPVGCRADSQLSHYEPVIYARHYCTLKSECLQVLDCWRGSFPSGLITKKRKNIFHDFFPQSVLRIFKIQLPLSFQTLQQVTF